MRFSLFKWMNVFWNKLLSFRRLYPNCRAYIDATEVRMQGTKVQEGKVVCYSSYKAGDTLKLFIACSPDGTITFLSLSGGGGITDSAQVIKSGFLELIECGDEILADKGVYDSFCDNYLPILSLNSTMNIRLLSS